MKIFQLKTYSFLSAIGALILATALSFGCVDLIEYDLPEEGSTPDFELPTAFFTYNQDAAQYQLFQFQSLSTEAGIFSWDFGNGDSSTEENPIYVFPEDGTYTVTLRASDANGAFAVYSEEIAVETPTIITPAILESSFEDNALPDGTGDGRDSWRNNALGGVIQITTSPVFSGNQASKYPAEGDRIAYQELIVSDGADYRLTFYYTLKTDTPGSITVDILAGGDHTDASQAEVLASFTGTDQTDASTFLEGSIDFNTGENQLISIYIHNEGAEARLDEISIEAR